MIGRNNVTPKSIKDYLEVQIAVNLVSLSLLLGVGLHSLCSTFWEGEREKCFAMFAYNMSSSFSSSPWTLIDPTMTIIMINCNFCVKMNKDRNRSIRFQAFCVFHQISFRSALNIRQHLSFPWLLFTEQRQTHISRRSVQCDQIGPFLNSLVTNFLSKVTQIFANFKGLALL